MQVTLMGIRSIACTEHTVNNEFDVGIIMRNKGNVPFIWPFFFLLKPKIRIPNTEKGEKKWICIVLKWWHHSFSQEIDKSAKEQSHAHTYTFQLNCTKYYALWIWSVSYWVLFVLKMNSNSFSLEFIVVNWWLLFVKDVNRRKKKYE